MVVLYVLCDSSQDDLVLKLCQHQGQAERPAVPWRVSVPFKIPEEICQPGSSTTQPALCPPKDTALLTPPYSPKPKYYHLGFSVPKMGSDQMVISGPAVPIPVCSSEHFSAAAPANPGPRMSAEILLQLYTVGPGVCLHTPAQGGGCVGIII